MQALAAMTPTERYNAQLRRTARRSWRGPFRDRNSTLAAPLTGSRKLRRKRLRSRAKTEARHPCMPAGRHRRPAELAAGNSKLEQFNAEMRQQGLQTTPQPDSGRFVQDSRTGVTYDSAAVQRAHAIFASIPAAERDAARAEYQETLAEIYAGKLQLSDMEGSTAPEQPRDAQGRLASAPESKPAAPGWQSHIEDGAWVDIGKLTLDDTSGYTIPRYVNDQRLNVSTFELLRAAKAAGISQAQVNAVFHGQALQHGWVKA